MFIFSLLLLRFFSSLFGLLRLIWLLMLAFDFEIKIDFLVESITFQALLLKTKQNSNVASLHENKQTSKHFDVDLFQGNVVISGKFPFVRSLIVNLFSFGAFFFSEISCQRKLMTSKLYCHTVGVQV